MKTIPKISTVTVFTSGLAHDSVVTHMKKKETGVSTVAFNLILKRPTIFQSLWRQIDEPRSAEFHPDNISE